MQKPDPLYLDQVMFYFILYLIMKIAILIVFIYVNQGLRLIPVRVIHVVKH